MVISLLFWLFVLDLGMALAADAFLCAGQVPGATASAPPSAAAKPIAGLTTRTRQALVLFARFRGQGWTAIPAWAADLLDPDLAGSFSHFYDTMSFGALQVRGQVAPQVYESAHDARFYLAADDTAQGRYGDFAQEILAQADQYVDFAQFDNDGPDGVPASGRITP